MTDMEKLSAEELDQVAGGKSSDSTTFWTDAVVYGTTHYLALRDEPAYDSRNEIGKCHNGDVIKVRTDIKSSMYIWAKVGGKQGWVNGNYVQVIN